MMRYHSILLGSSLCKYSHSLDPMEYKGRYMNGNLLDVIIVSHGRYMLVIYIYIYIYVKYV